MKNFAAFFILILATSVQAYKSTGFEQIDPNGAQKKAIKIGLVITGQEKQIKKELVRLKKKKPSEFKEKLKNGVENSTFYQGYLLEVEEGLEKVEKAKTIAKYVLYKKVEDNWTQLKRTSLNRVSEDSFNKFKSVLISDLQTTVYLKKDQGYKFEVPLWGAVTVSTNLKAVTWRMEFATKGDNNKLEDGAEDIKIQQSPSDSAPSTDEDTGL